ncbi:MAG: NUDIX domain-containing protein [Thermomicrobiales bacterium]
MSQSRERFRLIVAVHILIRQDDRVLLLRRFNTGYEDGNYSLVAGHLDGNEEVVQAAIRETSEEAGIVVAPSAMKVAAVMHRQSDTERIDFFLETWEWTGTIENREPDKCDELAWFPINTLPSNTVPYIRHAIERITQGEWFQTFGWEQPTAPEAQTK